jgi:hypothetical protein
LSRLRSAHIGTHRDIHADVASEAGEQGAYREAARQDPVQRHAQHHEQHHTDHGDGRVLAVEVGLGTRLDGRGDFLHPGIAGAEPQDRKHRQHTVGDGE